MNATTQTTIKCPHCNATVRVYQVNGDVRVANHGSRKGGNSGLVCAKSTMADPEFATKQRAMWAAASEALAA